MFFHVFSMPFITIKPLYFNGYTVYAMTAEQWKPFFLYIMKKLYFFAFLPLYTTKRLTGKYFQLMHGKWIFAYIYIFHTRSNKSISKIDKKTHCEKVFFSDFLRRSLDYTAFMQGMEKLVVDFTTKSCYSILASRETGRTVGCRNRPRTVAR